MHSLLPARMLRVLAASVAMAMLAVMSLASAWAAPVPDAGPTTGGTRVGGAVPDGVTFVDVAGGSSHSLGLGSDGWVYAWGLNFSGQLGDGSTTESPVPATVAAGAVPDGVTFTAVSVGGSHSLGLGSDGHVYAWGSNASGQLGDGSTANSSVPVAVTAGVVPEGVTFTAISAGNQHSLGIGSDGWVYAWGASDAGRLGNGTTVSSAVRAPVALAVGAVPAGVTFTALSAGTSHSVGLGSDGRAYAWGINGGADLSGRLGDGTTADSPVPVAVVAGALPAGVTFTAVSAQEFYSLGLGSDGWVYAWGGSRNGQLGHGSTANSLVPVPVAVGAVPAGVTFTTVSGGGSHSLASGTDGRVYAWGSGNAGRLGDGSTENSLVPVATVAGAVPVGVTLASVSAGTLHSSALGSDGRVYTWGAGSSGRLGNGATSNSSVPVMVASGVSAVESVAFGGVPGADLTQDSAGWSVATPAHACGVVDVEVTYTQFGRTSTQTIMDGFTYGAAPVVTTHPTSVTLPQGEHEVALSAAATGDEAPTVQWQQDTGTGWQDIPGATSTTLTTQITGTTDFRAVFSNACADVPTGTATVTLTPFVPPTLAGVPAAGVVGQEYSHDFTVTGDPAPTLTLTGTLPAGLVFDPEAATITGIPTAAGAFPLTLTASNGTAPDAQLQVELTIATVLDAAVAHDPIAAGAQQTVTGTGFAPGEQVQVDLGSTSMGTAEADAAGAVSVTFIVPVATSPGQHTVTLIGPSSGSVGVAFAVVAPAPQVPAIPPTLAGVPADGVVGQAYSHAFTVTGDPAPTVSLAGALPAGLDFDPDAATIAGTPTRAGTFPVTLTASNGSSPDAVLEVELVVAAVLDAAVAHDPIRAGAEQTVTGTGFAPGERVEIQLASTPTLVGTVDADPSGSVALTFAIPTATAPGEHTLTLTGPTSGSATVAFTVTAATPPGPGGGGGPGVGGGDPGTAGDDRGGDGWLAETGPAGPMGLAALAAALVIAGIVVLHRRRGHEPHQS